MTDGDSDWDPRAGPLCEVPVGVTVIDRSHESMTILDVDDRFVALAGYSREELCGETVRSLADPDADESCLARLDRALERAVPTTETVLCTRADGTTFWNHIRTIPELGRGERSDDGLLLHEDVSGERSRWVTLDRHTERLHASSTVQEVCDRVVTAATELLDCESCTVVLRDGEWLVPRATAGEQALDDNHRLALDRGLIGEAFRCGKPRCVDDVTDDDTTEIVTTHESSTSSRGIDQAETAPTYRAGLCIPLDEYGVFRVVTTHTGGLDDTDHALARRLSRHAATALERLDKRRELRRENERLSEFANVVCHDLRNPLTVLDGALELAQTTGETAQFERARRAVDRMHELIESQLAFARRGEQLDELETVDVVAAAETCWANVSTDEASLSVQTDQCIRASEQRVRQLLENLFRNAVEHGDAWQITLGELRDREGFYVADDGVGVPQSDQQTVFESGYTTTEAGTGFGLAICVRIADAHGWELTVTESRDGGARFEITGVDVL